MSHKSLYLQEASQEAQSTHPENAPAMLLCPISGDFMKKPVITPEGKVYDEEFILTYLKQKRKEERNDPISRNPLKVDDLKPFPELVRHIEDFTKRKEEYVKKKEAFILEVRKIVHQQGMLPDRPELFLCPISQELIKNPVITSKGKVYDRDSLINYLQIPHGKDELGLVLSPNDFVAFTEFKEQLNVFQFYLTKQQEQKTTEPKLSTSPFSLFNSLFTSLFGGDDPTDKDTKDDTPSHRL
ncbi:U-box domain-containing protein [Legionella lytica]|uniref:RING-type E3 ubiquitin transferase n=1 Tax=Legionella lytica TaxID=96232 RepID=A0ABW8D4X3_9GAMM